MLTLIEERYVHSYLLSCGFWCGAQMKRFLFRTNHRKLLIFFFFSRPSHMKDNQSDTKKTIVGANKIKTCGRTLTHGLLKLVQTTNKTNQPQPHIETLPLHWPSGTQPLTITPFNPPPRSHVPKSSHSVITRSQPFPPIPFERNMIHPTQCELATTPAHPNPAGGARPGRRSSHWRR